MSSFRSKPALPTMLALTLCGSLMIAISAASPAHSKRSVFQTARELLQAAYPELFGKDHFLNFATGQSIDNTWQEIIGLDFKVTELSYNDTSVRLSAVTGERLPAKPNPTLLCGQFAFDVAGRLLEVSTVGAEILNSKKNRSFAQLLAANPDWSDERVSQEFQNAGGDYGLGETKSFLARAHLKRFEPVLGRLNIAGVEFKRSSEGDQSANWWVTLSARLPDGLHRSYILIFEPFTTRLSFLTTKGVIAVPGSTSRLLSCSE